MEVLWKVFIAVRILMGVCAMMCNLLTLICVYKFTYLRSTANILVASLALSDFLHGSLTSVVLLFRDLPSTSWDTSHVLCLVGIFVEPTTIFTQFVSFSMLALQRRNSLLFQLNRSKKWEKKVVICVLCVMWAVIAVFNMTMTILYSDVPEGTACIIRFYFPGYYMSIGTAIFVMTCVTIVTAYSHIAYITYKSQKQVIAGAVSSKTQKNQQKDMRITRMMAMVVGTFLLLYIPVSITCLTMKPTAPPWQKSLHYVTILMYDINFWINPFIYAWRDKGFYKAFCRSLSSCPCRCSRWQAVDNHTGVIENAPQVQVSVIQIAALKSPPP